MFDTPSNENVSNKETLLEEISRESSIDIPKMQKVVLLGKGLVGKSSLISRLVNDRFEPNHSATLEDRYHYTVNYNQREIDVEILDTAGEDDFRGLLNCWIQFGEGFMLVFSYDSKESFKELQTFYENIQKIKKNAIIILIGNKSDLKNHEVNIKEAEELAEQWKVNFVSTSAKTGENCSKAFETLIFEMIEKDAVVLKQLEKMNKTSIERKNTSRKIVVILISFMVVFFVGVLLSIIFTLFF